MVDEEIALSVGNIHLTNYELKKNFDLFKRNTVAANKRPVTEPEIRNWVDDYTMRSYFLADAEAKGYYQRKDLIHAVEAMEGFILSQKGGPLEQQLVKHITPVFDKKVMEKSKKDILDRYYEELRMQSKVTIFQPVLLQLGNRLKRSGPVHKLDKRDFEAIIHKDIVQFTTAEGEPIHFSLEQFIDYYNALPVQQYLVNMESVTTYLYKIAYASYIRKDADRLGITHEPKFVLDKKNYMNSLVYRRYEEDFLKDTTVNKQERYKQLSKQYQKKGTVDYRRFS